jgi:hypothetical protein
VSASSPSATAARTPATPCSPAPTSAPTRPASATASSAAWPLTYEAVNYLAAVQIIADGNPVVGGRRTWGEVARLIRAGAIAEMDGFFEVVDV